MDLESDWQAILAAYQSAQKCDREEVVARVKLAGEFLAAGGFAYWRKETGAMPLRKLCDVRRGLFATLLDDAATWDRAGRPAAASATRGAPPSPFARGSLMSQASLDALDRLGLDNDNDQDMEDL